MRNPFKTPPRGAVPSETSANQPNRTDGQTRFAAGPIAGRRGHIGASGVQGASVTPVMLGVEQINGGPSAGPAEVFQPHWATGSNEIDGRMDGWQGGWGSRMRHQTASGGQGYTNVNSLAHWGGNSRLVNTFSPKLGYQASLTSYGFPSTWDTLRLVPANPQAAQGLERRTRPIIPSFGQRGGGHVQIPAVFVPVRGTGRR